MSFILTSRTRNRNPQGPVGVNWSNPITRSLSLALAAGYPDAVSKLQASTSAGVSLAGSAKGIVATSDGSEANLSVALPATFDPLGGATEATSLALVYLPAIPGSDKNFVGKPYGLFGQIQGTTGHLVVVSRSESLELTDGWKVPIQIPIGRWILVGVIKSGAGGTSSSYKGIIDGVIYPASTLVYSIFSPSSVPTGTSHGFALFNTGAYAHSVAAMFGFRRELSAAEVASLAANPWQLFSRERTPVFYSIAGVSPGPSTANRIMLLRRPGLSRVWR